MNDPIPFQPVDRATGAAQFFSRVQRYKTLLKRRWWVILITLTIAVGAQTYRASKTPLTYVAKAQMIVGNRAVVTDTAAQSQEENFVGTSIALFKGALLNNRAAENVKTNHPDFATSEVKIDVSLAPKTSIFLLTARGAYPKYTQAYLNALMDEFLKYRQEMRGKTTDETLRAIMAEAGRVQGEVMAAKKEMEVFRTTNSVANIELTAASAGQRVVDLENRITQFKNELSFLDSVNSLSAASASTSEKNATASLDTRDQDQARRQLEVLKAQRDEWAVTHRPKHPKMIRFEEQIAAQEKLVNVIAKQTLDQLNDRRNAVRAQIATLEATMKQEQKRALDASALLGVYETIKGRIQSAESLFARMTATLDQVKIVNNVPAENLQVLEPASKAHADNSGFTKNIIIGCFIGLVFGIGLLFILDRFDDRPVSFTELQEHFDELVLGQIPQDSSRTRNRKLLPLAQNDPRYAYAEAHRNLRSSLIFMATDGARPRTIVVTSAIPGEGKSTVAVNLAVTMAFAGSRVLLIDADMRKGTVHEYFDLGDQPGLADVLAGEMTWEKAVQATGIPNLEVISRGNYPSNPGELLLAGADVLMKEVQQHYDFVLFDSAPVLAADDTASLAPKVDGTLFVIRAAYTSARLARNALDLLYQRQVNVMGIVFNSVETRSREYYYFKYPEYYSKKLVTNR
jgi:polysaccharide biosynthesis transport protein